MPEFLLCVDVGNSRTKFGLFRRDPLDAGRPVLPKCLGSIAVPHDQDVPWDKFREVMPVRGIDPVAGMVAGSSPEGVARTLHDWPSDWPAPSVLDDVSRFSIEIRLSDPNKAGIDRILNAVACNVIRPSGRPAVIVDTGTATTVDAVSTDGAFEGGAILPGFELCARALHQYTALLPFITIDELNEESREPLGKNTREALRSGLLWGQIGAIKELGEQLGQRWEQSPFILLTGGGAPLAAPYLPQARWEPYLSLQGLAVVADRIRTEAR